MAGLTSRSNAWMSAFCTVFIIAQTCLGGNARAQPAGGYFAQEFDAYSAMALLQAIVLAVKDETTEVSAVDEARVIGEVMQMSLDQAFERYQRETLSGSVGWGPFRVGMDRDTFSREYSAVRQNYAHVRNHSEFRESFVRNSRRYLTPEGAKVVIEYVGTLERMHALDVQARFREYFQVLSTNATATAIPLRITWAAPPGSELHGAEIVRLRIDGTSIATDEYAGDTVANPYDFTVPRPHAGVVTVDVYWRVDGMGTATFSRTLTIPMFVPPEEPEIVARLAKLETEVGELRQAYSREVDALWGAVPTTKHRDDILAIAGQIEGLLHAITDSPVINSFTPQRQENLRLAKEHQIVNIINQLRAWQPRTRPGNVDEDDRDRN